jgi:hypothetical protein
VFQSQERRFRSHEAWVNALLHDCQGGGGVRRRGSLASAGSEQELSSELDAVRQSHDLQWRF